MRKSVFAFPLMFVILASFQNNTKLVKKKIGDGITMEVPENFVLVSSEEMKQRTRSDDEPLAYYTDPSGDVDLVVNLAYSRWRSTDLEMMRSFYKSNIMGLYDHVNFTRDDIEEINGKQFAVFEFVSKIDDDRNVSISGNAITKYVYIQYAIVNHKTVLCTFSCPARLKNYWAETAGKMMHSVVISKTL